MKKLLVLFFVAFISFALPASVVYAGDDVKKPQEEEEEPDCE